MTGMGGMSEREELALEHNLFERATFGRELVTFDELLAAYGEGVDS